MIALLLAAGWLTVVPPRIEGSAVPRGAMAWLRQHPEIATRRGYAGYNFSGYLLFDTPVRQVYLHALNAVIPLGLMNDERVLSDAQPGWQALLDRHQVEWALVSWQEPLAQALSQAPAWQRAWADPGTAVFVRRDLASGGPSVSPSFGPDGSPSGGR